MTPLIVMSPRATVAPGEISSLLRFPPYVNIVLAPCIPSVLGAVHPELPVTPHIDSQSDYL